MKNLALFIATLGPIGKSFPAPGTVGSAIAVFFAYFILQAGFFAMAAATLIVVIVGVWAANIYEAESGKKDASEVIIDEVAGQWSVLLITPLSPIGFLAAFLLFRLFDITKPFPVKQVESLPGGFGVMADDIAAGFIAGFVMILLMANGVIAT